MLIKSIRLINYRNYCEEQFEFHDKLNIITGKNAQGKTNLIEAINLLSLGKSFRTKREQEMITEGKDFFSVKGVFKKENKEYTVEIIHNSNETVRKKYLINGVEKDKIFDLFGGVYTIVFSPEDIEIVKGNPGERRSFLDREIILLRPLYYKKLRTYKRLLMNRNALLKQEEINKDLLDVYDEKMAEAGAEVVAERLAYIKILSEAGRKNEEDITNQKERLEIKYETNINKLEDNSETRRITKLLHEEIANTREKDIRVGSTEKGPHRDDFKLLVNGKDLKIFGSQGQKRTAALAIKLAEEKLIREEIGEAAIILLDDVMSELDIDRQNGIIESFKDNQIFITAADISESFISKLPEGKIINIESGRSSGVSQLKTEAACDII